MIRSKIRDGEAKFEKAWRFFDILLPSFGVAILSRLASKSLQSNRPSECQNFQLDDTDAEAKREHSRASFRISSRAFLTAPMEIGERQFPFFDGRYVALDKNGPFTARKGFLL